MVSLLPKMTSAMLTHSPESCFWLLCYLCWSALLYLLKYNTHKTLKVAFDYSSELLCCALKSKERQRLWVKIFNHCTTGPQMSYMQVLVDYNAKTKVSDVKLRSIPHLRGDVAAYVRSLSTSCNICQVTDSQFKAPNWSMILDRRTIVQRHSHSASNALTKHFFQLNLQTSVIWITIGCRICSDFSRQAEVTVRLSLHTFIVSYLHLRIFMCCTLDKSSYMFIRLRSETGRHSMHRSACAMHAFIVCIMQR